MTSILKKIFDFGENKSKQAQMNIGISNSQILIRELQRQKLKDLSNKIKQILDIVWKNKQSNGLYQISYESSMNQTLIQWIPTQNKLIKLLSTKSAFMNIVLEAQQYKVTIQKQYIPHFLFKNNILNEKSGYLGINNSVQGMIVPLIDYIFIRLMYALSELNFIEKLRQLNQQYQSDEMYYYMSRNPYLLLLNQYFQGFKNSQKIIKKLSYYVKMFFVDQILIKHRINKSLTIRNQLSFYSSSFKIKSHYFIVILILLKYGRQYFEQKTLWLSQIISKYQNLLEKDNVTNFRFFIRLYIMSFAKYSIENLVIDQLKKANIDNGIYKIQQYSNQQFKNNLKSIQKKDIIQFDQSKTLFLKLLEKDQNYFNLKKKSFGIIRSLQCYLILQIYSQGIGSIKRNVYEENSQAISLEKAMTLIFKFYLKFIKNQKSKQYQNFKQNNVKRLQQDLKNLQELYQQAYKRKFMLKQSIIEVSDDRNFNIRGLSSDYTNSLETYKSEIQIHPWKVPLKDSQFQILYNFFYELAKILDKLIPGSNNRKQPILNLRFLSNPLALLIILVTFIFLLKGIIWLRNQ